MNHDTARQEREAATVRLLASIGEQPDREGLRGTPARVARMWDELTAGYDADIDALLMSSVTGDCGFSCPDYDQMIVLRHIGFVSMCEHHLMPFIGEASVAYLPGEDGRVVGVSKLARVVEAFARRLQIQERMTQQIADAINTGLSPAGVGVHVRARHLCMVARGVKQQDAHMETTVLLGSFRQDARTRAEFMRAIQGGGHE